MTIHINNARVSLRPTNKYYQTIINAKFVDQSNEIVTELGIPYEDCFVYEYEVNDQLLVILWK